jgi:hypothetical protein
VVNGTTVTAKIEDLDEILAELLADETYDRCCVKTLARILLAWRRRTACNRDATAVVTVVCSDHGPDAWPVCRKHLGAIRRRPWLLHCPVCEQPAQLTEGAH